MTIYDITGYFMVRSCCFLPFGFCELVVGFCDVFERATCYLIMSVSSLHAKLN